jgi:hypothetical protein
MTRGQAHWSKSIEHTINALMAELRTRDGELRPPLDLRQIQERFRIISVEARPMIPEAAIHPTTGGFKVYLQNNFMDLPGTSFRQRFTLAHEFCHTLFYDCSTDPPKRLRGTPSAEKIEFLCHKGAGHLLVPAPLLESEISRLGDKVVANDIPALSKKFEVSVEVILRRLQESGPSMIDHAIILVEPSPEVSQFHICGAYYGPWILSYLEPPKYGIQFDQWLNRVSGVKTHRPHKGFQVPVAGATLVISDPVFTAQHKFLLDISLAPN